MQFRTYINLPKRFHLLRNSFRYLGDFSDSQPLQATSLIFSYCSFLLFDILCDISSDKSTALLFQTNFMLDGAFFQNFSFLRTHLILSTNVFFEVSNQIWPKLILGKLKPPLLNRLFARIGCHYLTINTCDC